MICAAPGFDIQIYRIADGLDTMDAAQNGTRVEDKGTVRWKERRIKRNSKMQERVQTVQVALA